MTRALTDRPSDAELIQTACRQVSVATLAVEGAEPTPVNVVHLFESQAFVLVPTDGDAVTLAGDCPDGIAAMVEVTDCAPIDLRERVRSLVWLNGTLHAVPTNLERDLAVEIATEHPDDGLLDLGHGSSMLRLQIDSAVIATSAGAASVPSAELAGATPDPFWEYEGDWIAHLDSDHADLVGQLVRRLPRDMRDGRVRPLGLDRFGIRFRIEGRGGDSDVRLPFKRPVSDVHELSQALRTLAGCPFLNSLPD
ncbi:MAG: DUF2470 domain-containing protein [Gordonia sp.]|jgi:hypothetical protein|uniref:DUF2470 domain-containing protein n=1 Tax=Gordonia sp. (in: high G+C Gram-positive bacteria) TaxID=84139 RepID=UPI000C596FE0|nr:DUF2470 domain-containing protein [Gordonia sp. (in: high G+C Gram-positive bacteria)]MAU80681.1 DUF2470 domain-containing protein [Gordonia sp. (in: high G+C Gram-positive bacteria)]